MAIEAGCRLRSSRHCVYAFDWPEFSTCFGSVELSLPLPTSSTSVRSVECDHVAHRYASLGMRAADLPDRPSGQQGRGCIRTHSMSAMPDQDGAGQARGDEAVLVARALAGDHAALGLLVARYTASVRRVTRAVLGDADDAEDAAQDGLLLALVKLDQYDEARPFGPWLMRIVTNAAIDRRRRRAVREMAALESDVAAAGPLPDVEAERLALGERLQAALGELPERYRMALVLFDVEGYSHAEIAEILGVASGTVRSAVFHARRRLRRRLGDWKEET